MKRTLFKPTLDQRQVVKELVSVGEPQRVIAAAIGVDAKTLRKHFSVELRDGYANRRKEIVALLFESARKGNTAAQRQSWRALLN